MCSDYRLTPYCTPFNEAEIMGKKQDFINRISVIRPRVFDFYNNIKENDEYKSEFHSIYSMRCAYCGLSYKLDSIKYFQIDHYIPEKSSRHSSSREKNHLKNLVLSCAMCNNAKSNLETIDEKRELDFHPEYGFLKKMFQRDDYFNIVISTEYENDAEVNRFFDKMQFSKEIKRLDYLVLYIRRLCDLLEAKKLNHSLLGLQKVRDKLSDFRNRQI